MLVEDIEKNWERAHTRHPSNKVIKSFVKSRMGIITKEIDIKKCTKILDVGCGNGWFTYYWGKFSDKVYGIDISPHMVKHNPCPNVQFGDAEKIQFKDGSFDVVFSSNLFHHLNNPSKAFDEMLRVSKRWVIITEPNSKSPLVKLFALINKHERQIMALPMLYEYIRNQPRCKIIKSVDIGMVSPASTPEWVLPICEIFDFPWRWAHWNMIMIRKY